MDIPVPWFFMIGKYTKIPSQSVMGFEVSPSNLGTATFQPWGLSLTRFSAGGSMTNWLNREFFQRKPTTTAPKKKKNTHTSDVWSKYVWLIFGKHVPFKDDMLLIATKILFQLKFALKLCMFSGPFPVGGATPPLGFPNPPFVFRFVSSLACGELWGWASEERFTGTPWVKLTAAFCRLPLENGRGKLP